MRDTFKDPATRPVRTAGRRAPLYLSRRLDSEPCRVGARRAESGAFNSATPVGQNVPPHQDRLRYVFLLQQRRAVRPLPHPAPFPAGDDMSEIPAGDQGGATRRSRLVLVPAIQQRVAPLDGAVRIRRRLSRWRRIGPLRPSIRSISIASGDLRTAAGRGLGLFDLSDVCLFPATWNASEAISGYEKPGEMVGPVGEVGIPKKSKKR